MLSFGAIMPYLDPARLKLWSPSVDSRPRCEIKGDRCIIATRLHRCFPFTAPKEFISIQDGSGREIGILRTLDGMDDMSRAVLESELDRRYFTPIVRRIVSLTQEASMWRWEVETQRGQVVFYLRGVRDSVHEVAPRRWQILGMDGQRYEIRDLEDLDARSKSLFESLF